MKVEFFLDDILKIINNFFNVNWISQCEWRTVRLERLSLLMIDVRAVLMLLSPQNDLSAIHKITVKNAENYYKSFILGSKLEI